MGQMVDSMCHIKGSPACHRDSLTGSDNLVTGNMPDAAYIFHSRLIFLSVYKGTKNIVTGSPLSCFKHLWICQLLSHQICNRLEKSLSLPQGECTSAFPFFVLSCEREGNMQQIAWCFDMELPRNLRHFTVQSVSTCVVKWCRWWSKVKGMARQQDWQGERTPFSLSIFLIILLNKHKRKKPLVYAV